MMRCVALAGLVLFSGLVQVGEVRAGEKEEGFVPLFDGQTLEGWEVKPHADRPVPEDQWYVEEDILKAREGWCWLSTQKKYRDFVLRLEWRIPENGNSGVFLRVPELEKGEHPHVKGIEIQVLDDEGSKYAGKLKPYQYSGSIYGVVPATNSTFKGAGEWNSYQITCRGNRLTVELNGRKVAEADISQESKLKNRPKKGFIGLQNHGSSVEYRNIQIKVLD